MIMTLEPSASQIDVTGILRGLLDVVVDDVEQTDPPRLQGTLLIVSAQSCPPRPEGWGNMRPHISSSNLTLVGDRLRLKAVPGIHINIHEPSFAISPTQMVPGDDGDLHGEPFVRIIKGGAHIGEKVFDLAGGSGEGSFSGSFSTGTGGQPRLDLTQVGVKFVLEVDDMPDTWLEITGSITAIGRAAAPTPASAWSPPSLPPAMAASPALPPPAMAASPALPPPAMAASPEHPPPSPPVTDKAHVSLSSKAPPPPAAGPWPPAAWPPPPPPPPPPAPGSPICDPPCGRHGTCTALPHSSGASALGRCACDCNWVGLGCSTFAPLRLQTAEPRGVAAGARANITIRGHLLGKLASLPPPESGPAFTVRAPGIRNFTGVDVIVLGEDEIAVEVPPLLSGQRLHFEAARGCAVSPTAPLATVTASGCGDPGDLDCGPNEQPTADGCSCTCKAGWRGEFCTSCDSDAACMGLLASPESGDADADGDADESGGDGDGQLTCRADDLRYYQGTWQKALSCNLLGLPPGVDPMVISLVCTRDSVGGEGDCELLVAPKDGKDRAEVGRDGFLDCVATGCSFEAGARGFNCRDVSCSFGMYQPIIDQTMPDLVVSGASALSCEEQEGRASGRCSLDLQVLPIQLVAECSASDCVDPNLMALEQGSAARAHIIVVSLISILICCIAAGAVAAARACRVQPPPPDVLQTSVYGGGATFLPEDYNKMPRINQLVFRDVRVAVASGREIVRGASGTANCGDVYGVIGASGSGKTTLLDAVAGVMAPGATRTGDVLLDGHAIPTHGVRLPAMVAYVRQEDNLSLTLTPRESVTFSAQVTLPLECTAQQRAAAVDSTLRSLGLRHIADTQLGGSAAAAQRVSGGERRRVAIAMSMIASPRVLLLDEPTSGLDSSSAHRLVSTLQSLAAQDRVVMLSIHQPSQRTFEKLTCALLMHQGLPVTVGSMHELRATLSRAQAPCDPLANLADHLLDITADEATVGRLRAETAARLAPASQPVFARPVGPAPWEEVHAARGWRGAAGQVVAELRALYWRIGLSVARHPALLRLHLVVVVVLALAVGLVFHGVGNNLASFQNRSGACFFVLALFGFSGLSAMEVFIAEHELMLRELQAGYYRLWTYFAAKISVDTVLLRAVPALLFSVLFYPIMGLRGEVPRFTTFVAVTTLVNMASGLLCAAISVLFESLGAANLAATILMLLLLLMNGALVNLRDVSPALKFGQSVSFFRYGFEALLTNELEDTIVMVDAPGITPIPVKSRVFLAVLGMDAENIPHDKTMLVFFCIGHAALALGLLYARASTWRPALFLRRTSRIRSSLGGGVRSGMSDKVHSGANGSAQMI